jgi:hypothetical protein
MTYGIDGMLDKTFFQQKKIADAICDKSGGATVNAAILFGVIALAVAGLATPILRDAAETYAENRALGIDRAVTGNVDKSKRYIIRRSVIDPEGSVVRP